jgi:DtxR family Mn-dependent transcriptional regulator
MMEPKNEKDEYLEILWYMQENTEKSFDHFKEELGDRFNATMITQLAGDEQIILDTQSNPRTIELSEKGREYTRKLIRSHRLAERLVHTVLGEVHETGACEFEHIVNPELVDSICTLLGHPRECPHGMPIPEGECCRQKLQTIESSIIPLTEMDVGEAARIAYVFSPHDQQLHKLESLQIRPGITVTLHQKRPTFVIECENATIALDEHVAVNIHVWSQRKRVQANRPRAERGLKRGYKHGQDYY